MIVGQEDFWDAISEFYIPISTTFAIRDYLFDLFYIDVTTDFGLGWRSKPNPHVGIFKLIGDSDLLIDQHVKKGQVYDYNNIDYDGRAEAYNRCYKANPNPYDACVEQYIICTM